MITMSEDCEGAQAMDGLMVKHMNPEARTKLANHLDPPTHTSTCGDWKHLADKLGYPYVEIMAMEERQSDSGSNTQKLLANYGLKLDSTIINLRTQLKAIRRPDAIEELDNAIPDIRKAYWKEQKQTSLCVSPESGIYQHAAGSMCSSCHPQNNHPGYYHMKSAPSGVPHRLHREHCFRHMSPGNGQQTHTNGHSSYPGRSRVSSSPGSSMNYQQCSGYSCNSTATCMSLPQNHHTRPHFSSTNTPHAGCPYQVTDKIQNVNRKEFHPMASVEDNNVNCSLEVNHAHSHIHARQSDFTETNSSVVHSCPHNDPPLPLHQGILRCLHNPADNIPPLMPVTNMDVGAEEEVFTSSDSSMSSNSYQGIVSEKPANVVIQQNQSLRCGRSSEKPRRLPMPNSQVAKQTLTNIGHTNRNMTELKMSNSESKLVNNCSSHPHRLVHSHSVDQIKSSHSSSNHLQKQRSVHMGNQLNSPGNGVAVPPKVKPKLSELCRGEVKIFVTYAADSAEHKKHVQVLFNCLKKNGFSPYLDCHDNGSFKEETWDHFFQRADFVLICVSPLYKILTEGHVNHSGIMSRCDPVNELLHTGHIYDQMKTEFGKETHNRRLIPVICRGATREHVPSWLRSTFFYKWPHDFRDLLWKLTKPRERASPCVRR